jgi:hypothetical protein
MTQARIRHCWKCKTPFFKVEGCNKVRLTQHTHVLGMYVYMCVCVCACMCVRVSKVEPLARVSHTLTLWLGLTVDAARAFR